MKLLVLILLSFFVMSAAISKNHDYMVYGKKFQGYVLKNKKSAPLVILIHDWDGLDGYEQKRSKMLHKLGYSVFALDMFGKGIRPSEVSERKKLTGALYANRNEMKKLMNGALAEAKKMGLSVNNASVVGYCFGGTAVLEWAKSGVALKGIASFHGNLDVKEGDSYKNLKGKINVYHGSADTAVSLQSFADLATLLEKEKVSHEMITYSGAPHAFTKFNSDRYHENADKKSWINFKAFLKDIHKN